MRRAGGASKVMGTLAFTEDQPMPGLTHVGLVTSYVPSADIRSVDAARALEVPGVVAVLTAGDLGLVEEGPDAPLANVRVSHVGQPVAAVIAETPQAAADAAELVEVQYDVLPAAIEVAEALAGDAPRVLPEAAAAGDEASAHGAGGGSADEGAPTAARPANVTSRVEVRRGDADAALAASDV